MSIELLNLNYYDFYQLLLTISILIIGLAVCLFFARKIIDIKYITALYIWHNLFSFIFYYRTLTNPSDATSYYIWSLTRDFLTPSPGTAFITYLTSFFSKSINANYFNSTLIYGVFGSIGVALFYLSLRKYLKLLPWYWNFIFFLPSLSYWSSAIGKDALSFLAVCTLLYGISTAKKSTIFYITSIILMLMVRPHVALIMVVSYVFYFIIRAKIHFILKLTTLPVITTASFILFQFAADYAGIDETSVDGVTEFYDNRQGINNHGGGGIDTSSMSVPIKVFSYMFRPLPFEANNAIAFMASIENTFLLLFFIYVLYTSKSNLKLLIEDKNLWLTTYVVFSSIMLSYGLSNLGIAARQKWMFMPIFIYLLIRLYSLRKQKKYYEVFNNC